MMLCCSSSGGGGGGDIINICLILFLVFHIIIQQKHYHSDLKKSYCYMKMIQKYRPEKIFCKRRKISRFIVDETQIKIGKE
jgi:hypothetical protein